MIKNKYFHGAKISSYGVSEGFLDYQCMAEMAQAEFIDIYSEDMKMPAGSYIMVRIAIIMIVIDILMIMNAALKELKS